MQKRGAELNCNFSNHCSHSKLWRGGWTREGYPMFAREQRRRRPLMARRHSVLRHTREYIFRFCLSSPRSSLSTVRRFTCYRIPPRTLSCFLDPRLSGTVHLVWRTLVVHTESGAYSHPRVSGRRSRRDSMWFVIRISCLPALSSFLRSA